MRMKEKVPEPRDHLVHRDKKTGLATWYTAKFHVVGNVTYHSWGRWFTDDGHEFADAHMALRHLKETAPPIELTSETKYKIEGFKKLKWSYKRDRISIETADGVIEIEVSN